MMGKYKLTLPALLLALVSFACVYIVLPEGVETPTPGSSTQQSGWTGIVTRVGDSGSGALRIELAIRNDTGDWGTMRAQDGKPAVLTGSDGKTTPCDTVFVGTGGHRLPPGFQIRGYTSGTPEKPETQLLYAECKGATAQAGARLRVDYVNFSGERDYYVEIEETNKAPGSFEVSLDEVAADLAYPIGKPVEGLVEGATAQLPALSDNVISLQKVERTAAGMQFTWQNTNPSKFALKTHIGIPPVVGKDGILYGVYETLDMPAVPLTPAGKSIEWTTEAPVPADVSGLYLLVSVESRKPRTYANHVLDISDK